MSLERYQRELLAYLYAPRAGEPSPSLAAHGVPPDRIARGLTVYRRNLIFALCRAMAETYPLCRDLLGEGNFNFLCKQYVHAFPSRVRDLGDYGERFADFLAGRPEIRAHPFLADVARLEWLCDRETRLPCDAWLVAEDLERQEMDGERLARSVLPLRTDWVILDLWQDHRRGGTEAIRPETIVQSPQYLLVWSEAGTAQVTAVMLERWRSVHYDDVPPNLPSG